MKNNGKSNGEYKDRYQQGWVNYTCPDGSTYVGELKDSELHGQGTLIYPDGMKCVSRYKNGHNHGQGTLIYPDGMMYVGKWKSGSCHGQGTLIYPDGEMYVGGFKNNAFHGQGTFTHVSGDKNEFKKKIIQYGTLVNYVGEWRDGEKYGRGTGVSFISMKRITETGDFVPSIERYVGEFLNGLPHGDGIYHYANGDKYIGTWRDGEVFGQGNFVPNGAEEVVTATSNIGKYFEDQKNVFNFDYWKKKPRNNK